MVEGVKLSSLRLALFLVALVPSAVRAHRLDEYLQATLVEVDPGYIRLQINLTPGVKVGDKVLALIDRDHNGAISTNEVAAYAGLLKNELIVRLDDRNLELQLTDSYCPGIDELRTGWAFVQVEYSAKVGSLVAGSHRISVRNHHLPAFSVYLLNAAQPKSGSIQIAKQLRNDTQSSGEIEFAFQASQSNSRLTPALGSSFFVVILLAAASAALILRKFRERAV